MTTIVVEGMGGKNPWAGKNIFFTLVFSFLGIGAYSASAYLLGLLSIEQALYIFSIAFLLLFITTMLNFIEFKSAKYLALFEIFGSPAALPAITISSSLAYYVGVPLIWDIIIFVVPLSFIYWSQSQEVKHSSLVKYFKFGLDNCYFRFEGGDILVYDLRYRKYASDYLGSIDYPHRNLAKIIRGAAIVSAFIVIPFGQKMAYANPSRDYSNAPVIFMLFAFAFFILAPHQFSIQIMLIKLDRAVRRGDIDLSAYEAASVARHDG